MKNFIFFIVWTMCAILCNRGAYAQSTVYYDMTLDEMFACADSANSYIQAFNTLIKEQKELTGEAKNRYLPSIDASLSLTYNGDGTITDRDFSNSFKAEIPAFGNSFSLQVSQVIFEGGAIRNNIKIRELQTEITRHDAYEKREEVRFLIVGNYLEMCNLSNQIKVLDNNIKLTCDLLDDMEARYKEGTALKNDITRYKLQLNQLEYQKTQTENSILIMNNRLITALGLNEGVIVPDIQKFPENTPVLAEEKWQQLRLTSSPALRKAEANVQLNEYSEKSIIANRYPKIAAIAAYNLNGPVTIEIPALNKNFSYWYAGIGITYNLSNLYKLKRTERAHRLKIQHADQALTACEEETSLTVNQAVIRYNESFLLLETKQKGAELANQNYNVISFRYNNGLALITDLLDASSQKIDAELQVVAAQINILYNYYKLKYLTGTL